MLHKFLKVTVLLFLTVLICILYFLRKAYSKRNSMPRKVFSICISNSLLKNRQFKKGTVSCEKGPGHLFFDSVDLFCILL
jgi:hypothetical protein